LYNEITLKIAKECSIKIQDNESNLDKVIVADSLRNYCKYTTKGRRGLRPKNIEEYLKIIVGGIISRAPPTLTRKINRLHIRL